MLNLHEIKNKIRLNIEIFSNVLQYLLVLTYQFASDGTTHMNEERTVHEVQPDNSYLALFKHSHDILNSYLLFKTT